MKFNSKIKINIPIGTSPLISSVNPTTAASATSLCY